MKSKLFYVYYLVDSLSKKPFYVGKGHGNRMYIHEKQAVYWKKAYNPYLKRRILSILRKGGKILPIKIFESSCEQEALLEEKKQILSIGRNNLCNLTDGGEGFSGGTFKQSSYQKEIVSKMFSGKAKTERHKDMLRKAKLMSPVRAWQGKKFSKDHKIKLSISAKGKRISNTTKKKISMKLKNIGHRPRIIPSGILHRQARLYEIHIKDKEQTQIYTTLSVIADQLSIKISTLFKLLKTGGTSRSGISIKLLANAYESS